MILGRIAHAIRHQNWSQIIVEVLIVIVGIFLGLQVQNWYEDKADRQAEKTYLNRMHTEASDVIEQARLFNEARGKILKNLHTLSDLLIADAEIAEFTNNHCASLALSHVYANRTVQLPTVSELTSSGGLELIENGNVRNAMAKYSIGLQLSSGILSSLKDGLTDFSHDYPEVVELQKYTINSDIEGQRVKCDFQAMKDTPAIKNIVLNSTTRYFFFVKYITGQFDILMELHNAVDAALKFSHEEPKI